MESVRPPVCCTCEPCSCTKGNSTAQRCRAVCRTVVVIATAAAVRRPVAGTRAENGTRPRRWTVRTVAVVTVPGTRPEGTATLPHTWIPVRGSTVVAAARTPRDNTVVVRSPRNTDYPAEVRFRRRDIAVRTGSTAGPAGRLALGTDRRDDTDIRDRAHRLWPRNLACPRFPVCLSACPSSSLSYKVLEIIEKLQCQQLLSSQCIIV